MGHRFEVIRVHAGAVTTDVIDLHAIRDGAMSLLVCEAVSVAAAGVNVAVASRLCGWHNAVLQLYKSTDIVRHDATFRSAVMTVSSQSHRSRKSHN